MNSFHLLLDICCLLFIVYCSLFVIDICGCKRVKAVDAERLKVEYRKLVEGLERTGTIAITDAIRADPGLLF